MFRIHALPLAPFAPLFQLDDQALAKRGARRVVADASPGFPCRVSLQDAAIGESLILVHHVHHPVDGPYRASGPLFVREAAAQAIPAEDEVPALFRHRLLSLHGYGQDGAHMHDARMVEGRALRDSIMAMLEDPRIDHVHLHYAGPGCYAAQARRT